MPVGALVDVGPGAEAVSLPGWALPAEPVVDRAALLAFSASCFRSAGVRAADARATADVLVLADARGHPSHGVSRLRQYLRLLDSGSVTRRPHVRVTARRAAMELWD